MRRYFKGHNGWGDNLHQRAAIRALLAAGDEVWLETSTPCVYHDLRCDRLHLVNSHTALRTQAKNLMRETNHFETKPAPNDLIQMPVSYDGIAVRRQGSVLHAMCQAFGVSTTAHDPDFTMPVAPEWRAKVPADAPSGPLIVYRPPVVREEWKGTEPRNPDPTAYGQIFAAIRGDYAVVSVADLAPEQEWIVGEHPMTDRDYHAGEMDFEALAALVESADFVYAPPGMMTVLAQAIGTPCITVFGGFEAAASFSGGALFSPWLAIEPIRPCTCWSHYHSCDKRIDVKRAIVRAREFMEDMQSGRGPATA